MSGPRTFRVPLPGRSVALAVYDWGGDGPVVLCAHANGFCGMLWQPVAEELVGQARVIAFDARGHGLSGVPRSPEAYSWRCLADDIVGLVDALAAGQGIDRIELGVGNSVGGTTMLAAAASRPERFARLALVDPVVLPRWRYADGDTGSDRLAETALSRRRSFASRAAVVEAYASRTLFADWDPRALMLYAEHGFRDTADGVELRCDPSVEAAVFSHAATLDVFDVAAGLHVPGEVMHATRNSFAAEPFAELCDVASALRLTSLDCGHLAPMIDPVLVAGRLRDALA